MSLDRELEPPESGYTDEEWETAERLLIEDFLERGLSEEECRVAVDDDYLIAQTCEVLREGRASQWADEDRARRKENR